MSTGINLPPGTGILRIASAQEVLEFQAQVKAEVEMEKKSSLYGFLVSIWEQNKSHREDSGVDAAMLAAKHARDAEYDPATLQAIRAQGGSDIYMALTPTKCRHGEAWLKDILHNEEEKVWGLKPTPLPEVSPFLVESALTEATQIVANERGEIESEQQLIEIADKIMAETHKRLMEGATRAATRMERKIHDQMVEGGWTCAFEEFLTDLVTMKAGIIKGPIPRKRKKKRWDFSGKKPKLKIEDDTVPTLERVDPMNFYPAPESDTAQKGGTAERQKLDRDDLAGKKGEKGYIDSAISAVLASFDQIELPGEEPEYEDELRDLEDKGSDEDVDYREFVDAIEFYCRVPGFLLKDFDLPKPPGGKLDPEKTYDINAILVGSHIVYLDYNREPLERRPYHSTGWAKVPGSFWYKGVPELMGDLQRMCNASARALANNMAVASGPQALINDIDRIPPGEDITSVYPFKVWQARNRSNSNSPAVTFFQPKSNASELMAVYDRFAQLADDYTSIPAYAFGNDRVAGAGRTSSGLSMLMSASARGIKEVIIRVDQDIFAPIIEQLYDWNMMYDEDSSIKGDVEVVATGAVSMMMKEQMATRRIEFLRATANEVDAPLMGKEGRANILREAAKSLEVAGQKTVLSAEELRELEEQEKAQAQQAQQFEMQARQAELELKQRQLRLEEQKVELEFVKARAEAEIKGAKVGADVAKVAADEERTSLEAIRETRKRQDEKANRQTNAAAGSPEGNA